MFSNLFLSAFYIWPDKQFSLFLVTSLYLCFPVFTLSIVSALTHSVSLGTDPPRKPQPSNFFCPPGPKKINKNPQVDKKSR